MADEEKKKKSRLKKRGRPKKYRANQLRVQRDGPCHTWRNHCDPELFVEHVNLWLAKKESGYKAAKMIGISQYTFYKYVKLILNGGEIPKEFWKKKRRKAGTDTDSTEEDGE